MPNWVHTTIQAEGDRKDLDQFVNFSKSEGREFDFDKYIPRPVEKDDDWYNWNCDNWGTKWNANYVEWDDETEDHLMVRFETAWSRISNELWEAIKAKFPALKFTFEADEEAGFFHCNTDNVNGLIVDIEGERQLS
tara:strand:+ start:699 stop:1106 length:408 start_codon:yes stop_codon:yes gene_type:complete